MSSKPTFTQRIHDLYHPERKPLLEWLGIQRNMRLQNNINGLTKVYPEKEMSAIIDSYKLTPISQTIKGFHYWKDIDELTNDLWSHTYDQALSLDQRNRAKNKLAIYDAAMKSSLREVLQYHERLFGETYGVAFQESITPLKVLQDENLRTVVERQALPNQESFNKYHEAVWRIYAENARLSLRTIPSSTRPKARAKFIIDYTWIHQKKPQETLLEEVLESVKAIHDVYVREDADRLYNETVIPRVVASVTGRESK